MDYDKVPPLLREIKKCLRRKGIKFQHFHESSIVTKSYSKELTPVIFSVEIDFPDRVTIQSIPLNAWSFSCSASNVDDLIKKAARFNNTVKSFLA